MRSFLFHRFRRASDGLACSGADDERHEHGRSIRDTAHSIGSRGRDKWRGGRQNPYGTTPFLSAGKIQIKQPCGPLMLCVVSFRRGEKRLSWQTLKITSHTSRRLRASSWHRLCPTFSSSRSSLGSQAALKTTVNYLLKAYRFREATIVPRVFWNFHHNHRQSNPPPSFLYEQSIIPRT